MSPLQKRISEKRKRENGDLKKAEWKIPLLPSLKVEEKYEMPFDDESSYQEELKKCRKTVNVFSTI